MMMEKDQSQVTERILELTLEIIYLLTGEDYEVVKKTYDDQLTPSRSLHRTSPITGPPPHCLKTDITSAKKILEVIQKIIKLLTVEVPIRCQDVTVSMEGYLEGHKDVMMASQPALTSPDGSSNGNPPERCPRPLYSRDSTQEDLTILHHHQNEELKELEVKKEEELILGVYEQSVEERSSLYSQDTTQEEQNIPQHDQGEEGKDIKVEVKEEEEETLVSGDQPSMEEEEEMIMKTKQEEYSLHMDTNIHLRSSSADKPTHPSNPEESSLSHEGDHTGERSLALLVCKKYFSENRELLRHEESHTSEHKRQEKYVQPKRRHWGESPFFCSECGKCFKRKAFLDLHQKKHTEERPLSCTECGKVFKRKRNLVAHQKIHIGDLPFSCSECGKCFALNVKLRIHQKTHTGIRPYSCSECGKDFTMKGNLVKHQKIHTGERPYSCSECGKCFAEKAKLHTHQRIHLGERANLCS